jgi:hypothetical protein
MRLLSFYPPRFRTAPAAVLLSTDSRAEWSGVGGYSNIQPPVLNPTTTDSDGDGLTDSWENSNSLNSYNQQDAASDFDQDGLTALQEYQLNEFF